MACFSSLGYFILQSVFTGKKGENYASQAFICEQYISNYIVFQLLSPHVSLLFVQCEIIACGVIKMNCGSHSNINLKYFDNYINYHMSQTKILVLYALLNRLKYDILGPFALLNLSGISYKIFPVYIVILGVIVCLCCMLLF